MELLRDAIAIYANLGVRVEGVVTDNGSGYKKIYDLACAELGIRHPRTKPYTPKTNGKVDRFVQTSFREWAYAKSYRSSACERPLCSPSSITTAGIDHTRLFVTSRPCLGFRL